MRIIKKNVYYCEFCKKKGLSAGHMNTHELYCTGNINRRCGVCNSKVDYGPFIDRFKAQMKSKTAENYGTDDDLEMGHVWVSVIVEQKPNLAEIFDVVEDCPACVLTILRACGLGGHEWDMKFDWKTEREKWWANNKPSFGEER